MTVLALDQSSKTTGYAIFKDNKLDTYGKFEFNDADTGVRLNKIRYEVYTLIQLHRPDYVIFEDIQLQNNVGNNVQTFKILAEVYGVISELLTQVKIPHSSILASSWKNQLNIKGKTRAEQKNNAKRYIESKYNIQVSQDIVDAICIGESYLQNNSCAW